MGWDYTSTGTLGTDIYVTDIRMYDITSGANNLAGASKTGIMSANRLFDRDMKSAKIFVDSEIMANDFIEF